MQIKPPQPIGDSDFVLIFHLSEAQYNATLLFQMLIRSKLATKRVLRDYRLSEDAFNFVRD